MDRIATIATRLRTGRQRPRRRRANVFRVYMCIEKMGTPTPTQRCQLIKSHGRGVWSGDIPGGQKVEVDTWKGVFTIPIYPGNGFGYSLYRSPHKPIPIYGYKSGYKEMALWHPTEQKWVYTTFERWCGGGKSGERFDYIYVSILIDQIHHDMARWIDTHSPTDEICVKAHNQWFANCTII